MTKYSEPIPAVSVSYVGTGKSSNANELGMRPMQERAYQRRGEQYLLIKSPPASGKSRALMFIALDKLHNQGIKKAIIVVPERSIGGSFADEPLTKHGFWTDWHVEPRWNLCNVAGIDDTRVAKSKVKAVGEFLSSEDRVLVCTHATFRFSVDDLGIEAFDDCLLAVDEFHHVSASADNRLGMQLSALIGRDKAHIVAMTGSYFRGDADPVLSPTDEMKFTTVTYTYYEQLNGYQYLKSLRIEYCFYTESYLNSIMSVLDANLKTIVHIPSVNSRESTQKGKTNEVNEILEALGNWEGEDLETGFHLVRTLDGRLLKVADLVDDEAVRRDRVVSALKDPRHRNDRDHVDIIIALGMAKEGFDWIWCEHALTVGYRSSLTEVVQIIGRATRDAPGKFVAKFTNLIAEPVADQDRVTEALNDTLKAISASLLMEQVLAPRFDFTPKNNGAKAGFDYGSSGYVEGQTNIGFNDVTGQVHVEIAGFVQPKSEEAKRICSEDINEVIAAFVQKKDIIERGLFDEETAPEELTRLKMGKIIRERYPELDESDQEAVRLQAIAALNITQQTAAASTQDASEVASTGEASTADRIGSTAFVDGVRRFALSVRQLDVDLIDSINPFQAAYAIVAKAFDAHTLMQVKEAISARRVEMSLDDARLLAKRALRFKEERGRLPSLTSADIWERQMAEAVKRLENHRRSARA